MSKIYLSVPFEKKDIAKSFGCFWDKKEKLWYFLSDIGDEARNNILDKFDEALPTIVYLTSEYEHKNDIKAHGGRFDFDAARWYIPRNCSKKNYKYLKNKYT